MKTANVDKKCRGFSLIELLVVIAIISILAAIGMTVYADAQKKARDARRVSDIDSLAKALELHKNQNGTYPIISSTWFGSSESFPTADPKGYPYCVSSTAVSTGTLADNPTASWTTACPTTPSYIQVSTSNPVASSLLWKICTWLEVDPASPTSSTGKVYCRWNTQ